MLLVQYNRYMAYEQKLEGSNNVGLLIGSATPMKKKRRKARVIFTGSGRTNRTSKVIKTPKGDKRTTSRSMGVEGRVGVSVPFKSGAIGAGVSGHFAKGTTKTADQGKSKWLSKRLSGGDLSYTTKGGTSFSGSISTPHSKERRTMFRVKIPF